MGWWYNEGESLTNQYYRYRSAGEGLCAGWCITGIHTTGDQGDARNKATRFNAEVMGIVNYVAGLP